MSPERSRRGDAASRRVAILVDNDDPGRQHGAAVADALAGTAAAVRVVELPGLPPKGDVFDYLAAGHTVDDVAAAVAAAPPHRPATAKGAPSVRDLIRQYPALRPPVIHGLLRRGETMNVTAPPKTGKSWLVLDLAIAVACGRRWLNTFEVEPGPVLIIDDELHGETMANRVPRVAAGRGVMIDEFADDLFVENVRGRLRDIFGLESYFADVQPGRFKLVILDAFCRFLPADGDENDNAGMAGIYNFLDRLADRHGCCFVLIHRTSKGVQSGKAVTDVGSGAGSQSRATDTHLVLRQHEEDGVVVLDAAVRSWPPPQPLCLRWAFPVWQPDPDLNPESLRQENRRKRKDETATTEPAAQPRPVWTTAELVTRFLSDRPRTEAQVLVDADPAELSERKAKRLLDVAVQEGKAHRWTHPDRTKPHQFATVPQPLFEVSGEPHK